MNEKPLNPEKSKLKKGSERKQLRLYRQRKKRALIQSREETTNDTTVPVTCKKHQQSTDSSENLKSFRTKQCLSRSIKKAEKTLPFSPTKKKEVINGLAKRYQLRIQYIEKRGLKPYVWTEDKQEWLVNVFDPPDITYLNPGRKDDIYVGRKDEKREYVQKRYLLWTLSDLLKIPPALIRMAAESLSTPLSIAINNSFKI